MLGMLENLDPIVIFMALHMGVQYYLSTKRKQMPHTAEKVGVVSKITIYPFKGGQGMEITEGTCHYAGLESNGLLDRQWAAIDKKGNLVSSSGSYKLTTITPTFQNGTLCLNAPNMDTLHLPREPRDNTVVKCTMAHMKSSLLAYDCGDEASKWVTKVLNDSKDYRIVYHCPLLGKRQVQLARKPALRKHPEPGVEDKIGFQNERPFLLGTDASLLDLNSHLETPLPMARFRPNFVIQSDCPAFDEDGWNEIFIGSAKFTTFQLCDRCAVTTVVHDKGCRDPEGEPLKTLRKYRKLVEGGPCFCTCLLVETPGTVSIGDPVFVIKHSKIYGF